MERTLQLPPGCPVTTLTCLPYADRVVVTLAQAAAFSAVLSAAPGADGDMESKTLLGDREDSAASFYAQKLGEAVFKLTGKPLVLMLGLKKAPAVADADDEDAEAAAFAVLRAALQAVVEALSPSD